VMALHNPHMRVSVVDKDEARIRRWNSRHPPIYEPGLSEILRIARDGSRECSFPNGRREIRHAPFQRQRVNLFLRVQ
jgi:UDPglucose 6-dehydrogenase